MPLDTKLAPRVFDGSALPTVPAPLTLHAHTPSEAVEWRDGMIVAYDPSTEQHHGGMVPWDGMLPSLAKRSRQFWGAHALDFLRSHEASLQGVGLSIGQRLIFIGTVYMETGYSVARQKYNTRSRRVFRALERQGDDMYHEIIVPRSGYWVRGRDLIASR